MLITSYYTLVVIIGAVMFMGITALVYGGVWLTSAFIASSVKSDRYKMSIIIAASSVIVLTVACCVLLLPDVVSWACGVFGVERVY